MYMHTSKAITPIHILVHWPFHFTAMHVHTLSLMSKLHPVSRQLLCRRGRCTVIVRSTWLYCAYSYTTSYQIRTDTDSK